MKKISILLAAVMLLGMLAACGNQPAAQSAQPTASAEPTVSATAEPSEEPSDEPTPAETNTPEPSAEPSEEPAQTPEPSAEPTVTTAFEMYKQYYDDAGNIIEIPQLLEDSEAAKQINEKLRAIGDKYYSEYIDSFVGIRACEVIAYPCETEDYLCVLLTVKELPDGKTDGKLYSFIYDRKNQAELAIDITVDEEALKQDMKSDMEYIGITELCPRITAGGRTDIYLNVKYSIDGTEYQGFYVKSGDYFLQYLGGSLTPTNAVAVFDEPLWCQRDGNNNQKYDTTESDERIQELGEQLKSLVIAKQKLTLRPQQLTAMLDSTVKTQLEPGKAEKTLMFAVFHEPSGTVYGVYYYSFERECFCGYDDNGDLVKLS